jgi:hypothetical protein
VKQRSSVIGFLGAAAILVAAAGFCSMVWLSQPPTTTDNADEFNMTAVVSETLVSTSAPTTLPDSVASNALIH